MRQVTCCHNINDMIFMFVTAKEGDKTEDNSSAPATGVHGPAPTPGASEGSRRARRPTLCELGICNFTQQQPQRCKNQRRRQINSEAK